MFPCTVAVAEQALPPNVHVCAAVTAMSNDNVTLPTTVEMPPAPREMPLPLMVGEVPEMAMEFSDRPLMSLFVDGPLKTRSSPLTGATPPLPFAPLLQ